MRFALPRRRSGVRDPQRPLIKTHGQQRLGPASQQVEAGHRVWPPGWTRVPDPIGPLALTGRPLRPVQRIEMDRFSDATKTVLVVEADFVERERLADALEAAGYEALMCAGPLEPDYACIGGREGWCPLMDKADVV